MLILDFYVDEPACLGVPPYLSPYVRYTAGALVSAGIPQEKIKYCTVDQFRSMGKILNFEPEVVFLIAGATVPGKYLGGKIGTVVDILEFLEFRNRHQKGGVTLIGGPICNATEDIRSSIENLGGVIIDGDIEFYAHKIASSQVGIKATYQQMLANSGRLKQRRSAEELEKWSQAGAFIGNLHPSFPYLIIELESYRGCTRREFCSFCTEPLYGPPSFRKIGGILSETEELSKMGHNYFRLGRQADLLTYQSDLTNYRKGFPKPNPQAIRELYEGIRKCAPSLKVLHLDNINPGTIVAFPDESKEILKIICEYNTPGDTAAMGLESTDPKVAASNKLKCDSAGAMLAIAAVNEFGSRRENGIPKLLPGLNFLQGLPGESQSTFKLNYDFLKSVADAGLLLRRTNIRRVHAYPRTSLYQNSPSNPSPKIRGKKSLSATELKFIFYKEKIRKEIDKPMLLLSFPPGTVIKEVILEFKNEGYFFGRPLGSYPITVKIPLNDAKAADNYSQKKPINVVIVNSEERSLLALSHPIDFNSLEINILKTVHGIGKKRAQDIFFKRPFHSKKEIEERCQLTLPGKDEDYTFP